MDATQPQRHTFPEGDDLGTLVRNVRDAISAIPVYFRTATRIEGLDGGELFNLSAVLGSAIKNVLSGEPVVYEPYIEQARYVAEFRNWWWANARETDDTLDQRQVNPPDEEVGPYPAPKTRTADQPVKDGGNNFGRVARLAGLMDDYTSSLRAQRIAGIPADHWTQFFKRHAEAKDPAAILDHLTRDLRQSGLNTVQIRQSDAQLGRQGRIGVGVVGDETHVEGTRETEHLGPDVAHAQRAQGESYQAGAVVNGLLGPARRPPAREAVLGEELAGQGEDEGQDRHRDRPPYSVRGDHHRHVIGAARRQVHVVVTDAEPCHHRQTPVRGQAAAPPTRGTRRIRASTSTSCAAEISGSGSR